MGQWVYEEGAGSPGRGLLKLGSWHPLHGNCREDASLPLYQVVSTGKWMDWSSVYFMLRGLGMKMLFAKGSHTNKGPQDFEVLASTCQL